MKVYEAPSIRNVALVGHGFITVGDFRPPVTGADGELVEAGGAHLLLDRSLRAGAHRHHRQHGGYADGDSKHGERGLQAITPQRLQRDVDHGVTQARTNHGRLP